MLQKVIILTLHRQNELCNGYFGRMRRDDHKLNKVLPDTRMVNTNRYKKNPIIPWWLVHCQHT